MTSPLGVTPGMSHRYGLRSVHTHARFVVPYLKPGVDVLDVGCGPGAITLGIAELVAPGQVVGIDKDVGHVEAAARLAHERGIGNVRFETADVYELPFAEGTFDAVFEHSVLIHLPDVLAAVRAIHCVLKPGGFFAASDTAMVGHLIGNKDALLEQGYELFFRWQSYRGSDLNVGLRLRQMLHEARFEDIVGNASYDLEGGDPESIGEHAATMAGLITGPLGDVAVREGWASREELEAIASRWHEWAEEPGSFMANAMGEAIGWKPGGAS